MSQDFICPPRWIDAHCHLADPRWEGALAGVIARSRARGVGRWIQGGVSPDDWDRQVALRGEYGKAVVTAFGLHPWWVASPSQSQAQVEQGLAALAARAGEADAVGELGLDWGPRHLSARDRQLGAFEAQLAIARGARKPLVLHIVRAHEDAIRVLQSHGPFPDRGIVHSFSGAYETGKKYLDLGFLLSIAGVITREGFQTLKKAVRKFPMDQLVVETDAPDQTPRLSGLASGARNEPAYLPDIAECLAGHLGTTGEKILAQSAKNLEGLFGSL